MASFFSSLCIISLLLAPASLPKTTAAASEQHFVLVHGLGHGAWCWYKVITLLERMGHKVTALDLTSNGVSKTVADTVTSLAEYAKPLIDFMANNVTAEKVILVGHSFGGISISYAMEMFQDKISKAIFFAAFMPSNGNSFFSSLSPMMIARLNETQPVVYYNPYGLPAPTSFNFNLTLARYLLYNRSPAVDVNLAYLLLNPTPFAPTQAILNLTSANYGSVRRFYIRTGLDRVVLPSEQDYIIQSNPPERVFGLRTSDHSAFFSQPSALVKLLCHISLM